MSWLEWSGVGFFVLLYSLAGASLWIWGLLSGKFNNWNAALILLAGVAAGPLFWVLWRQGFKWWDHLRQEARDEEFPSHRTDPASPDMKTAGTETKIPPP